MTTRSRILGFGAALLLVVGGAVGAAVAGGETGQLLALVLIACGLVIATSLVFFEVGRSEDRERERAARRARDRERPLTHVDPTRPRRVPGRRRRPG